MALIALGAVEDGASGDVFLGVLARMILGEQLCAGRRCQQEDGDESQEPRAKGHLATLYTRFAALSTFTGQRSVRRWPDPRPTDPVCLRVDATYSYFSGQGAVPLLRRASRHERPLFSHREGTPQAGARGHDAYARPNA